MHERVFRSLKDRPKLFKTQINLMTAGGSTLKILGKINVSLKIGGAELSQDFVVVSDLNRNLILGLDFMKANKVRLYFDLKSMRIQDKVYVSLEEDIHIASTVRMKHKVTLKPKTAKVCMGKVRFSPDLPVNRNYEVTEIDKGFIVNEPGLKVINTVANLNRHREIPMLVVNNTDKFQTVYRHGLMARISEVSGDNIKTVCSVVTDLNKTQKGKIDFRDLNVNGEYRSEIENLIFENQDLFAAKDSELGHTDTVKMEINTGKHEPIKLRPYRTPLRNQEVVDKAIDEMLEADIIKRSKSPWSFPVVIVDKKDGSKRFCVDYRSLNKISVKNSFPLPLIDDILSLLGKSKYFTSLDLKSGYWQVLMDEKDKEKTAFACHRGLFEFNVMPFGLSNAPAVFQELMSVVLQGFSNFAIAYLDDILIFSESLESHLDHIRTVFERLRSHGLKLKLKKCAFLQKETNYLGFVINEQGIKPDPKKVESIKSIPTPTCVREVRSFIGMCSYYRRFIPNFSAIAEPIIQLTRKYAHFKWSPEHQKAFDFLKDSLAVVPLLVYPNPNKKYTLYTDASDTCIGACLTQEYEDNDKPREAFNTPIEKPIYYLSHKLNKSQCNYSVIEKEAYAIYYALQKLDYYLHNAEFTIKTDHKPLKYLLESPMTNKRIQLWALSIAGYNCKIEYIKGSTNTCADLLSRHPLNVNAEPSDSVECDVNDNSFQVNVINSNQFNPKQFASCDVPDDDTLQKPEFSLPGIDLVTEQSKDDEITKLKSVLLHGEPDKSVSRKHIVVDALLYYISDPDGEAALRVYTPQHLREMIIRAYHDENGHMGCQKCYDSIRLKYYWPNLFKELYNYISKCTICQTRSLQKIRQPLQETDQPPYPMAKLSLDLSGPYPKTLSGNKYIIAFVDWYSGWPEAFSVPNKEASTVAHLLMEEIFPRFGCPLQIVTDNGTENVNRVMKEVMAVLNIDHVLTSVYHPQSNAKVERFHRTLHDILSKKINESQETWDICLNQALAAIRFNVSESSKYSPYFLLYGRDVVLPVDNLFKLRRKYQGEDMHQIMLQEQHKTFIQVRRHMKKAKKRQAKYHDRNTKQVEFSIGDPVFYKNNQKKSKLDARWVPYHRVIEKTGPASYVIKNQLTGTTSKVHAEMLRLAKIDWDDVESDEQQVRPMRKGQYVIPPRSESESETQDSDDEEPLLKLARKYRHERSDSESEDDIPLLELSKRLKSREQAAAQSKTQQELPIEPMQQVIQRDVETEDDHDVSHHEDMDVDVVENNEKSNTPSEASVNKIWKIFSDMF